MSLLDPSSKDAAARAIQTKLDERYRFLCMVQREGIDMVWRSRTGLSPQEICDGLGDTAARVFQFHGILTDALVQVAAAEGIAPDIKYPTNKFTANPDGTVTILEEPYFDPEPEE